MQYAVKVIAKHDKGGKFVEEVKSVFDRIYNESALAEATRHICEDPEMDDETIDKYVVPQLKEIDYGVISRRAFNTLVAVGSGNPKYQPLIEQLESKMKGDPRFRVADEIIYDSGKYDSQDIVQDRFLYSSESSKEYPITFSKK